MPNADLQKEMSGEEGVPSAQGAHLKRPRSEPRARDSLVNPTGQPAILSLAFLLERGQYSPNRLSVS